MKPTRYYYTAQVIGWSLYVLISTAVFIMSGTELTVKVIGGIYLVFALGLLVTHIYRYVIIKLGWLESNLNFLLFRVGIACIVLSIVFHSLYLGIGNLVFGWNIDFTWKDPNIVTWGMLFFIWSLIYFSYSFFQRFRKEEIKNLKLEATKNEYELRRLKDQMNPHFIFNAMNTIRALIDEEPVKAKRAVTQLSNVLRSSLQAGKMDLISLKDECALVCDYLEIEKARYEERLEVNWNLPDEVLKEKIPPLMLQTLVENSIKHGISKLPEGGSVNIDAQLNEGELELSVTNSGRYDPQHRSDSSLGLENTRERLRLSFGASANLEIKNLNGSMVKTTVHIPINKTIHDTDINR